MTLRTRMMQAVYLLGRKRAQREMSDLAARFECLNTQTANEIRSLRADITKLHPLESAHASERDETETQQRWLH